ncbi:efflux RND transporter permease subunit [bacterium]|nr:efflux RND transporter permease subunit [bacterium]
MPDQMRSSPSPLQRLIAACLDNRLVVFLVLGAVIVQGILVAPFDWRLPGFPRDPVPVDAIPDIGENQQIVFTEWMGRSPQDVEDQITYPLTVALLGIPGVKDIRSYSMFGFSSIYVIFQEKVDFYWSRTRILEKLNSLPPGVLPDDARPTLGPDATALGQVFWYTLEGRDENGQPAGGWGPEELRSIQDWYVRYALQSAEGVAEVASIGGYIKEYQIDVNPAAMKEHGVTLPQVYTAVRQSNQDVGARTIEINRVEYIVRGVGQIASLEDLEGTVVTVRDHRPVTIADIAHVSLGPAARRGALDKEGSEAAGGVVVVRYGENPLAAITAVKEKIAEISPGLPEKLLEDGRRSKVTVVPFYDRTGLIRETLSTLNTALGNEVLITIIVILLMIMHLRSSILISSLLPVTILAVFIGMKAAGVDANIVALSGIAIAIGTIVDMGIVVSENMLSRLSESPDGANPLQCIRESVSEVSGAVLTAVSTTVVSFLPVFAMSGPEGKLFKPLAYTKTFALIASIVLALTVLPSLGYYLFSLRSPARRVAGYIRAALIPLGLIVGALVMWLPGAVIAAYGLLHYFEPRLSSRWRQRLPSIVNWVVIFVVMVLLAALWLPLGAGQSAAANVLFSILVIGIVMGGLKLFTGSYPAMLRWALAHKAFTLSVPSVMIVVMLFIWLGFGRMFSWMPAAVRQTAAYRSLSGTFPGLGREFMPPLDEGSFLYMPTTMPHAGMEEALDIVSTIDRALLTVPEVETVVGKIGRADTPLDPAPLSMIETIINYRSEYITDERGKRLRFRVDGEGNFLRDEAGGLVSDPRGKPFRQWRDHIRTPDDIWEGIIAAASLPGVTSAPKLQPISTRLVMLQSGMRAPMGVKVFGPDLETIERVAGQIEILLKEVPAVKPSAVIADRIVGKPYLEIRIDRDEAARYGISVGSIQHAIEVAVGGKRITETIEGRERYPVRVRYMRERRNDSESLGEILVAAPDGTQVPLGQLAEVAYVRGPQVIKSEHTFLVGYVLFDKAEGWAETDAVEAAAAYLQEKMETGELVIPSGVSYRFAGSYENQVRAAQKLRLILPLALLVIFLILYFHFKQVSTALFVFTGIFVAWSGGFFLLWLYGQDWFLNVSLFGMNMRTLFQMHPVNLSVAVWVGFLALFGIATDDGVLISTYLMQRFKEDRPDTPAAVRDAVVAAGARRIRPAMMTTATTILALIPVLTSSGRGADVMVPMAIPSFGGMVFEIMTVFVVPVLWTIREERRVKKARS